MARRFETQKATLIEEVAAGIRHGRPAAEAATLDEFVRQYYAHVSPDDLAASSVETLQRAALSLWEHIQTRKPGRAKIRIFNTDPKRQGWRAERTIIEIVNDDMPFLVDSVTAELNQQGVAVHLLIHPVVRVRRDKTGRLEALLAAGVADEAAVAESVMHIEISEQTLPEMPKKLRDGLEAVLEDVRAAVADWRAMRVKIADAIAEIDAEPPPPDAGDVVEARDFLRWIENNHFTLLGCRDYAFGPENEGGRRAVVARSGLGILRRADVAVHDGLDAGVAPAAAAVIDFMKQRRLLRIAKATRLSTVHRRAPLDTIAVQHYDASGRVVGERLFVGLFTSSVFSQDARAIPFLRRKIEAVVERAGFAATSHDGKALLHIIETLPRDELFQIDEAVLLETSLGILHLQERQRVALFVHRDPYGRFASCLVFVPRDRFNTKLRERLQAIVADDLGGTVTTFQTQVGESVLARLHFIVRLGSERAPAVSVDAIEAKLIEAARDWVDDLAHALAEDRGAGSGASLFRAYGEAFPAGYREIFNSRSAVLDIARIEAAQKSGRIAMELFRADGAPDDALRLKIFQPGGPVPLSDVLPVFENLGLRVIEEVPYRVSPRDAKPVWIHDFGVVVRSGKPIVVDAIKTTFEDVFSRVWSGEMENDGFNRLVIAAGLGWRPIVMLRTYCKWMLQTGIPFSQSYMEATLAGNAPITEMMVELFECLFDPAAQAGAAKRAERIGARLDAALDGVSNLDEDRILRRWRAAIEATLRTNYYQPGADGAPKPYLSVKIDSRRIDELPLPRPCVEVYVYSPRVEGCHLRGGKVARGGIRWSDRREDFRTEVLGLMKAQMTKNAVIVPVGAKGGFVVKRPPADGGREAFLAEGVACYQTLIRGLLDITDNQLPGRLVPPKAVVRRDDDDPYLVVAADKGTATFSDIANGVAAEYGFWLDDAFASGGSAGYDHKKMGITARGAWESVKRHFREIGTDVQTTPFTCVGVGDMSGDVFGNGLLQSDRTKLVAAFNHLHIFVDPDPDPAASFAERRRLFALPRSNWTDYDVATISKGGGVFERKAKAIPVSPEMRARFGLAAKETIAPADLVHAILRAEVDLLFLGGIGTYVKAASESHAQVGDRGNDALRVDARTLRCKVVGEGANLGFTQKARIEYALGGGRINTDFIDNSAGVDTSDHEVNIKILLGEVMQAGGLDRAGRDALLARMTDEVAGLVLMDNYRQSMALTHAEAQAVAMLDDGARYMRALERADRLNRAVEHLPDDEALAERRAARKGLTRPELSVLLAYAKINLYGTLLETDLPDDPHLVQDVGLYFPSALREHHGAAIPRHRLRREIVATYVTNSLVNRMGPTFVFELAERTGATAPDIVRAYLVARQVLDARALWAAVEALDNRLEAGCQTRLHLDIQAVLRRLTLWFLRNAPRPLDVAGAIAAFAPGTAALAAANGSLVPEAMRAE
ncbi:MAG: NAD-glutamate dehydrogenase, partial [Alphaproteobacteria bacterium]|nr:NAD-glutamate dehydrogenase [Alphaproteobacteria bacterium]